MSVRDIEFQEAIRRASERYGKHKRAVQQIWRRAEDSPTYALSTARELAVKTRYWRRRGRRYLYSRFGVKVRSRGAATIYAGVRPERSPGSSRERLLRAEAVIEHAEWESVWRAVWKCQNFGPADQARMACKFACEAMRQSPALWGFFIEKDLEPDDSVRQHAAAQLAGWLDNEVRRFPRTRLDWPAPAKRSLKRSRPWRRRHGARFSPASRSGSRTLMSADLASGERRGRWRGSSSSVTSGSLRPTGNRRTATGTSLSRCPLKALRSGDKSLDVCHGEDERRNPRDARRDSPRGHDEPPCLQG
jgi:hypothetical protein